MYQLQTTNNQHHTLRNMPNNLQSRTSQTTTTPLHRQLPQTSKTNPRNCYSLLALWWNSKTKRPMDSRSHTANRPQLTTRSCSQIMQQQTRKQNMTHTTTTTHTATQHNKHNQHQHQTPPRTNTFFPNDASETPRRRDCVRNRVLSCFLGR